MKKSTFGSKLKNSDNPLINYWRFDKKNFQRGIFTIEIILTISQTRSHWPIPEAFFAIDLL